MAQTVAATAKADRGAEYGAIAVVSIAHFTNHFLNLVLPPLFPLLAVSLGAGFTELGLVLTVANVLSVAAQLPVGFIVDRIGARRMLMLGLSIQGLAFVALGLGPSYPHLLVAMAFVGLANSVFHPADYAILSARIAPARLGRAFSIHTFAGFIGFALAPVTMLALVGLIGLGAGLTAAGLFALAAIVPLALVRGARAGAPTPHGRPAAGRRRLGLTALLTPTILALTGFFTLLSLSGNGISNFSVAALTRAFGTPLSIANLALTAYLTAQAIGVLAGGFIADLTRRHAEVAGIGFALNAVIVLAIAALALPAAPLITAMAGAGLLGGLIMPSRDMLVRAAAPPGAMGRTFGIVTTGFNFGGMIGPLLFGFILDHGAPRWVFGASVAVMVVTAALALVGDRRSTRRRAASVAAEPAE